MSRSAQSEEPSSPLRGASRVLANRISASQNRLSQLMFMFERLPEDIQDKIWTDVLDSYRQTHKERYGRNLRSELKFRTSSEDIGHFIQLLNEIDGLEERVALVADYFQGLADENRIAVIRSGNDKYEDIYLYDPDTDTFGPVIAQSNRRRFGEIYGEDYLPNYPMPPMEVDEFRHFSNVNVGVGDMIYKIWLIIDGDLYIVED